jgi:PEP-CTERM motif
MSIDRVLDSLQGVVPFLCRQVDCDFRSLHAGGVGQRHFCLSVVAAAVLAAVSSSAFAGVILDGASTFPASAAVFTSAADNTERDIRPTTPPRNNSQSFQVANSFQIDSVFVQYQAPTGSGYLDGNINLRIYPVADTGVAGTNGNEAPDPSGADLLNVPIALDAAVRTAANFTTSTSVTSALMFDLTGADEITLPATTGTAGYVIQFQMADAGATAGGFFTWRGVTGNPYAGGRWYDATNNQGANDGALAITAVPEPGTLALLLAGIGLVTLPRRCR